MVGPNNLHCLECTCSEEHSKNDIRNLVLQRFLNRTIFTSCGVARCDVAWRGTACGMARRVAWRGVQRGMAVRVAGAVLCGVVCGVV